MSHPLKQRGQLSHVAAISDILADRTPNPNGPLLQQNVSRTRGNDADHQQENVILYNACCGYVDSIVNESKIISVCRIIRLAHTRA